MSCFRRLKHDFELDDNFDYFFKETEFDKSHPKIDENAIARLIWIFNDFYKTDIDSQQSMKALIKT